MHVANGNHVFWGPFPPKKMVDLVSHWMKANGDETSLAIKAASAAYVIHSDDITHWSILIQSYVV